MLIMGHELSEKVLHHQYASDKKGDGSSLSGGRSGRTNSSSEYVVMCRWADIVPAFGLKHVSLSDF